MGNHPHGRGQCRRPRFSDGGFRELGGPSTMPSSCWGLKCEMTFPRHHFLKLLETASASVCARILAANRKFDDTVLLQRRQRFAADARPVRTMRLLFSEIEGP